MSRPIAGFALFVYLWADHINQKLTRTKMDDKRKDYGTISYSDLSHPSTWQSSNIPLYLNFKK